MLIVKTPLRVSFFGGGTDYPEYFIKNGGAVVGSAIDKYCYITLNKFFSRFFDYNIRLTYRESEVVTDVNEIKHRVIKACLNQFSISKDIEIHTIADLPSFTGLGSSSSFTVCLLSSLYKYTGKNVSPIDLAYNAIYIERQVLNENVGCQDQTFAAIGGLNLFEFISEDNIKVTPLNLTVKKTIELEEQLFLIYTGIKRSANELAGKQIDRVALNRDILGKMHKMALTGAEIISTDSDFERFGKLLHEAWILKKSLEKSISISYIDEIYNAGLENGALGGKLLGAGGGGFVLFFVPHDSQNKFISHFVNQEVLTIKLNSEGATTIFNS